VRAKLWYYSIYVEVHALRPQTLMIEWPFGLVRQLLYDNQLSSCCAPTYVLPFKVTTRYIVLCTYEHCIRGCHFDKTGHIFPQFSM
jgi:hypothetical protein